MDSTIGTGDEDNSDEITYDSETTDEITTNSIYSEPKTKFILLGFTNFINKQKHITFQLFVEKFIQHYIQDLYILLLEYL